MLGPPTLFLDKFSCLQKAFELEGSAEVSAEKSESVCTPPEYEAGEKWRREQDEHCLFAVVCKLRGACTPTESRICTVFTPA